MVFKALMEARLYCQLPKCDFAKDEVYYLGHVVSHNGVKPDPDKVKCVQEWPVPTDLHQLRQFLGLANYFRKFIYQYSKITAPLTNLTRQGPTSTSHLTAWKRSTHSNADSLMHQC